MFKHTLFWIILALSCAAAAQGNPRNGAPATEKGAYERLVTSAPFSAESITEVIQTASDGSHVRRATTAVVARDSEGRTRFSQSLSSLLPGPQRVLTIIRDPVAGVRYLIDSKETVARREPLPSASMTAKPALPWTPQEAAAKVARQSLLSMLSGRVNAALTQGLRVDLTPLGDQTMEGLLTTGARATTVVPVGQMDNEKALTFVSEAWYAPELSIIVMSKVSDPILGETDFQLTKLKRAEPNPSFFEIPSGYRIAGPGFPNHQEDLRQENDER